MLMPTLTLRTLGVGNDEFTTLLLHCDGADGSTTFTDSSSEGHTVTANGDAQIDTAQSKFGGASGLFDGTGDYLSVPDDATLQAGTGDFTLDFWLRWNTTNLVFPTIWDKGYTGTGALLVQGSNAATQALTVYMSGSSICTEGSSVSDSSWYHYAIVRNGTSVKIYRDGTETASGTSSVNLNNTTGVAICARNSGPGANAVNGWLQELRWSKGAARYTSSFTPATEAYG
jgi:hypothetical protein